MRTLFDALRTLPSRILSTFNLTAISRTSSSLPLNANAEVREVTCNPSTFVSEFSNSSVMPSLKYSFSGSPLRFTNGKTAKRFSGGFVFPFNSSRDGTTKLAFETAKIRTGSFTFFNSKKPSSRSEISF